MSSQWRVKSDPESQPVTFEQLADAVACGRLSESELVRPDSEDEWRKIEDVPGLDRAVRRLLQATSRTASVNARCLKRRT
ncbi:MAG: GYF domain-containing protein [Planctomycetaceae bacterium]